MGCFLNILYLNIFNRNADKNIEERSFTCWEIVHGIKSPDARFPCRKPFITEALEMSPSRQT